MKYACAFHLFSLWVQLAKRVSTSFWCLNIVISGSQEYWGNQKVNFTAFHKKWLMSLYRVISCNVHNVFFYPLPQLCKQISVILYTTVTHSVVYYFAWLPQWQIWLMASGIHTICISFKSETFSRSPKLQNLPPGFACPILEWLQIWSNNLMHYLELSQFYCAFSVMACQAWMQSQKADFSDHLMI